MEPQAKTITSLSKYLSSAITSPVFHRLLYHSSFRRVLLKAIEKTAYQISIVQADMPSREARDDQYNLIRALIAELDRACSRHSCSPQTLDKITRIFLSRLLSRGSMNRVPVSSTEGKSVRPSFVTISPTNACNLACTGCYAGNIRKAQHLDFDVVDRIINEMKEQFGTYFFVISGGEPFLYKSKGRTLLDLFEAHQDAIFLVYSNGTRIDEPKAEKLASLGNAFPAISVEGFEKETDERRGRGTFALISDAMDNLRRHGVLFGISVTPCSRNAELLLSDEFLDFYFNRKGASFGWYFQYMPIGRAPQFDLMVSPEQRDWMRRRIWEKVREHRYFIADFWNSGTASNGCISAGRKYFYVMWDGTVTPCVFIPYVDKEYNNIYDIYGRGGSLKDILYSPFFTALRAWQREYREGGCGSHCGNLLTPCIIRDHCRSFRSIVRATGALPVGGNTGGNYLDLVDSGVMVDYNREYGNLADPVWEYQYLDAAEAEISKLA
jgi:MoaA/NifB/PqqE/SkfB family radical SAM enzyme